MENQRETIPHDMKDVKEPVLLDKQTCMDIRIPAHLVEEPDEEEKNNIKQNW